MQIEAYDVVVLGSGQGGKQLAWHLGKAGKKVAVVERRWIGGSCPAVACMPSKNEIWGARVAHVARNAAPFGTIVGAVRTDMRRVRGRKQDMVDREIAAHSAAYEDSGAELDLGIRPLRRAEDDRGRAERGRLQDLDRCGGGHRRRHPCCRAGNIPGLIEARPLTHIEALELDVLPSHLIVLGGGYVGIEMAQAFRRLGSRVTVIEPGPQIMSREDADVAQEMREILTRDGIEILFEAKPASVTGLSGDEVTVRLHTRDGEKTIEGSDLLVATGRVANTAGLKLESTGVELDDRGFIRVDERLRTTRPGSGRSENAREARSSPTFRSTISGSCGTTWPAATGGPTTAWCPT